MEIRLRDVFRWITIVCIFLAAMNFRAKFFYFAFIALIAVLMSRKKIYIDTSSVLYLFIGLLMGAYQASNGIMASIRCMAYVSLYLVGINFINATPVNEISKESNDKIYKDAYKLLFAVSAGSFAHYMVNFVINIGKSDVSRNAYDVWTGKVMAATGHSVLCSLMIGLAVSLVLTPKNKREMLFGVLCIVGILAYNMILAGRSVLVILALALVVGSIFLISNKAIGKYRKSIIALGLIITFLIIAFVANLWGVRDYFKSSNLYDRFDDSTQEELAASGREERKSFYLTNMYKYPFGGLNMRNEVGYAHDLLLDAYDEYGALALALLILILISGIRELLNFCRNKRIEVRYRMAFLCVYVVVLCEFCIEPIFAGMQWLFVCYCMINGCLTKINILEKSETINLQVKGNV